MTTARPSHQSSQTLSATCSVNGLATNPKTTTATSFPVANRTALTLDEAFVELLELALADTAGTEKAVSTIAVM